MGKRRTPLLALAYRWLTPPARRYGVGISWRCMTHENGSEHHLEVIFINPTDGGDPVVIPVGAIAVWQYGGTPLHFTFLTAGGNEVLNFGDCGRVRVINGFVEEA